MEFIQPDGWQEAWEARATYFGAKGIMGGSGIMVDLNADGKVGKDKR